MSNDKVYKDVESFVVERSRWLRGSPAGTLLDEEGKMCCLGFYARACGFSEEDIKGIPSPFSLVYTKKIPWETKLLKDAATNLCSSEACRDAIRTNDNECLRDPEREADLIDTFNSIGVTLTFVD